MSITLTTSIEKLIKDRGNHTVGYFSSIVEPRQIDGGAKCKVDIDNFELVELYFESDDQETPYIKPLTDNTKKGYIVDSSEILHYEALETKLGFFNGKGTMANVYVQEPGVTFKTNNFVAGHDVTPAKGMYAKWVAGKSETAPSPEANGHFEIVSVKPADKNNVFIVWGTTEDLTEELLGLDTIELMIPQVDMA